MKASYYEEFGDLNQIKTGELDRPEPGEGELLIRVKSAGVNPVDAAIARGMLKNAIPTEFPVIPGWDAAGVIEERGHSARRFKEGDEVYAYARRPKIHGGTFAEYTVLPESYVALRPSKISMEASGGIPLAGLTAYQSLFDAAGLKEGETVLILGASGGVGTFAIQLAKAVGARVIGVAGKPNFDYMKELGADEVVDYKDNHVGVTVSDIEPDGVDVIFHCSRGNSLNESKGTLKPGGRLVSITNRKPDVTEDVNFNYVFVEPNAAQLNHIRELADDGRIKVSVSKTYGLERVGKALQEIESLHTRGKKIISP